MGIVPRNSFRPPVPFLSSKWGGRELSILLLVTGPLWRAARKVTHLVVFPWVAPLSVVSGVYLPKSDVRLLEFGEEGARRSPTQLSRTRRQMANIFSTFVTSASPVKHNPCRVTRPLLPLRCIHSLNGFRSSCPYVSLGPFINDVS